MKKEIFLQWGINNNGLFNDIEFFKNKDEAAEMLSLLIGGEHPGLTAFAQHGSGSLYAMYHDQVLWIDMGGAATYILANNIEEFVDLLHLDANCFSELANQCQCNQESTEELEKQFDKECIKEYQQQARDNYSDGYESFVEWAAENGRAFPTNIVERLVTLRNNCPKNLSLGRSFPV